MNCVYTTNEDLFKIFFVQKTEDNCTGSSSFHECNSLRVSAFALSAVLLAA